ncbi:MAG TPA: cation transporter [Rhodospirillales bacterium]|jgi:Co/Zn/Cd efflux system component|nr:cation transporter [Rhodospirillaceae bacterium]HJO75004.1 cation transporter [Rhodospirillales bacterium]
MTVKNDCCADLGPATGPFRRVLWAVLVINASMFVIEMTAGVWGKSVALQADALDFLGDSATYAITLIVLGMSIRWRAAAAMVKGLTMGGFGIWVLGNTVYHMARGTLPDFAIMGSIGAMALLANVISAGLLYGYRQGDSNMRSVWLCSRNDAIANIAVILAASGVWAMSTGWPDLAVGMVIAGLALTSSVAVIRQALGELKLETA